MQQEKLQLLTESPTNFARFLLYQQVDAEHEHVLNHDGNVVLVSGNKSFHQLSLYRSVYKAVMEPETEILHLSPHVAPARGTIGLLSDIMDKPPVEADLFGVDRTTQSEIDFDNGSSILSTIPRSDGNKLRGQHPDMLCVDLMMMEGSAFDRQLIEDSIIPLINETETVWVRTTGMLDGNVLNALTDNSVLVANVGRSEPN